MHLKLLILFILLILSSSVFALIPQNSFDLKDTYDMLNVKNFTALDGYIATSKICTVANGLCTTAINGTLWVTTGSNYMYNASNILMVNETKMNSTIYNYMTNHNFIPGMANTYDIGSSGSKWSNIYINGLTSTGQLIVTGLITSQNIIPDTDDLYTLGNSTNWYDTIYVNNIYAHNIQTNNLNSTNITSTDIGTSRINVSNNITLGGYKIIDDGTNLVIQI